MSSVFARLLTVFLPKMGKDTNFKTTEPDTKCMAKCGHETQMSGTISKFGKEMAISLFRKDNAVPEHCLQCFSDAAIACAWCGELILPSDPVTLYGSSDPDFKPADGSVVYEEEGEQSDDKHYVGCLRWNCAETGADRQGFWVFPGKVERCVSPLEHSMATGGAVIVSDLSDRNEALRVIPD